MIVVIIESNRFSNNQQDSDFHFQGVDVHFLSASIIYAKNAPESLGAYHGG